MDNKTEKAREYIPQLRELGRRNKAWRSLITSMCDAFDEALSEKPEPCEDLQTAADNLAIDCIGERVPVAVEKIKIHMEAYAEIVASRRLQELRKQLETMREALGKYANPCNWAFADDNVERVWFEPDRSTPEAYPGYELAQKALAATEPKP